MTSCRWLTCNSSRRSTLSRHPAPDDIPGPRSTGLVRGRDARTALTSSCLHTHRLQRRDRSPERPASSQGRFRSKRPCGQPGRACQGDGKPGQASNACRTRCQGSDSGRIRAAVRAGCCWKPAGRRSENAWRRRRHMVEGRRRRDASRPRLPRTIRWSVGTGWSGSSSRHGSRWRPEALPGYRCASAMLLHTGLGS